MIYANIRYKGKERFIKPQEHDKIYDIMVDATDNDVEICIDAASWCELASVGEIYTFREGEIEIIDTERSRK